MEQNNGNIDVDNNEKIIKPSGRPRKDEKYKKQREDILKKMNTLLKVTDTNKVFYIYDIDNNQKLIDDIMAMKDDISAYFRSKSCRVFSKKEIQREYMSLVKIVYKEMKVGIIYSMKTITRDNKNFKSGMYFIGLK